MTDRVIGLVDAVQGVRTASDSMMVLPDDLECDVALKLSECQRGMAFGIILAPFLDVAGGRSRKQLNRAHLRADQPFYVAAEMGSARRPPIELCAFVPASALECVTSKVRAVVDMYRSWVSLSSNHVVLANTECSMHKLVDNREGASMVR
ncbi:hypothetical protein NKH36_31950 [Mesorhizobium sp. M1312]|uniref:hypothetical protein n=1 Tax=unclassified Mesorhizobium TaxID=325217 RepID=UPI003337B412